MLLSYALVSCLTLVLTLSYFNAIERGNKTDRVVSALFAGVIWPLTWLCWLSALLGKILKHYIEKKELIDNIKELKKKADDALYKKIDDEINGMLRKKWIV